MIVAASFAVATPSAAAPLPLPSDVPGGFATWDELAAMQIKLNAVATKIQTAASALADNGYSNVIAAPEHRQLDVYWKGTVPAEIQALIAQQRRVVPIRVLKAQFNAEELIGEARRLGKDPAVAEAAPMPDGSGVQIRLAPGISAAAVLASSKLPLIQGEPAGPPSLWTCSSGASYCREDDSPYYYGGARTNNCTAGFSVNWNGNSRMLYAGHCGSNGTVVRDGGGQTMGNMINDNDSRDTAMIDARSLGRMWDGGNLSTFSKAVQGATFSNIGNWLCNSGSRSGVICGIQVKLNNVTRDNRYPMVVAERTNHLQAGGPGDSGGPLFELPAPDNGKVIAKGIMHGPDTTTAVACTIGEPTSNCAWRFYYADVTQTLAFYGATIITS
jgi:hypothetical protein